MKYVLGVFAVIVVLILSIILISNRGNRSTENSQTGDQTVDLLDYTDKAGGTLLFETEGELRGDDERRAIRISVTRVERKVEILSGYKEEVIDSKSLPNTDEAYEALIYALDKAGYSRKQEPRYDSDKGACPFGKVYIYKLEDGSDDVIRSWSTSCSRRDGDFGGDASRVRRLFEKQIPDYRSITTDVRL